MICYTHRDNRAIGICKYCGKAVCDKCAIVGDSGVACSERCHQKLLAYAAMDKRTKAIHGMKSRGMMIFLLATGIISLVLGVLAAFAGDDISLFFLPMAGILLTLGVLTYINIRKTGIRS